MLNFLMSVLGNLLLASAVVLPVAWAIASIKLVGPKEMAVRVIFGKPHSFHDSGFCFVPWFFGFNYLVRFPKAMIQLNQKEIKVISMAGDYPKGSGVHYNPVDTSIIAALYLLFPREREMLVDGAGKCVCFLKDLNAQQLAEVKATDSTIYNNVLVTLEKEHPLLEAVRSSVPTDKESLQDFTEEAVNSAVRAAAAKKTWRESNENIKDFNREVEGIFKGDADGALIRAGFRPNGIKLAIQSVEPPPEVKAAYSGREAAESVAEKDSEESAGRVLRMVARTSGKTTKELSEDLKAHPKKRGKSAAEGGYKEAFAYAEDQTKRDRAGEGLDDIRVGNVDGSPLEPILGTVASMFGLGKRKSSRRKDNPSGNQGKKPGGQGGGNPPANPGGNPGGGTKSDEQRAQDYFDQYKKWPFWWDPVAKKVK